MKSKEDMIGFYEKNRKWLGDIVANAEYPRVLRAAAGAIIEVSLEGQKNRPDRLRGSDPGANANAEESPHTTVDRNNLDPSGKKSKGHRVGLI